MDEINIISHKGEGTIIRLKKHLTTSRALCN
jgi:stage II sporulation protein AB (anti-sigma F factor)